MIKLFEYKCGISDRCKYGDNCPHDLYPLPEHLCRHCTAYGLYRTRPEDIARARLKLQQEDKDG